MYVARLLQREMLHLGPFDGLQIECVHGKRTKDFGFIIAAANTHGVVPLPGRLDLNRVFFFFFF